VQDSIVEYFFRINSRKISFFRFLLEGYDGLAVLSTVDAKQGLIKLLVPTTRVGDFWPFLDAICHDLRKDDTGDLHL